jgi:hypothetical protein
VIGSPPLADELKAPYEACCRELFDSAVTLLAGDKEGGVARSLSTWQPLMRSVGRHRGRPVEKQVLDILSYEARVALDRCYSAVWDLLLLVHLTQA